MATLGHSSPEAEFYASIKAAIQTWGIESIMFDLGWAVPPDEVLRGMHGTSM